MSYTFFTDSVSALVGGSDAAPTQLLYSLFPPETEKPSPETPPPSLTQSELDRQYPPDFYISAPVDRILNHNGSVMVNA